MGLAVIARLFAGATFGTFNVDRLVIAFGIGSALDGIFKLVGNRPRNLEKGFCRANPDGTDFIAGNMPAAAQ